MWQDAQSEGGSVVQDVAASYERSPSHLLEKLGQEVLERDAVERELRRLLQWQEECIKLVEGLLPPNELEQIKTEYQQIKKRLR